MNIFKLGLCGFVLLTIATSPCAQAGSIGDKAEKTPSKMAVRMRRLRDACEKMLKPAKAPIPQSAWGKKLLKGVPLYRDEGPVWESDIQTMRDLEVTQEGILGRLGQFLLTPYGKSRLSGMLHNPALSQAEILRRQSAVKFLAEHRDAREKIQAILRKFVDLGIYDLSQNFLTNKYIILPKEARSVNFVIAITILGGLIGDVVWTSLFSKFIAGTSLLGFRNITANVDLRNQLLNYRAFFKTAPELYNLLGELETESLSEIRDTLDAVGNSNHPIGIYNTAQKFLRMFPSVPGWVVDFVNITPNSLRVPRRSLSQNQEGFAKLLGAVGDLDLYQALAERHAQHGNLVFPEILSEKEKPTIEIVEGHSPAVQEEKADESVPNSISFGGATGKTVVNLAGHTGRQTFLELIGEYILAGSTGASLPAKFVRFTPMGVQTSMVPADSSAPKLYPQIEEAGARLNRASDGKNVIFLFAGLFRGSSPDENQDLKIGILEYIAFMPNALGVIVTNDPNLLELANDHPDILNMHVSVNDEGKRILNEGPAPELPSEEKMAISAGMPDEIVRRIRARVLGRQRRQHFDGPADGPQDDGE